VAKEVYTKENYEKLNAAIENYKGTKGALMPVLHEGQKIFGSLPLEIQRIISKGLKVPLADIYGVVTFYSQFSLVPNGEHHIGVCLGTACYVKGSQAIIDRISRDLNVKIGSTSESGKYSLEATRCIGACGLAPVITIGEDVYGRLVESDIPDILKKYQEDADS